jgi:hypothetical protein
MFRFVLVLSLALGLPACASCPAPASAAAVHATTREQAVRVELYFGRFRGTTLIPEADFIAFEEEVISTALPNGYTIVPAQGTYRGANGELIREPSMMLVVVFDDSVPLDDIDRAIERIRASYGDRFGQEAVLRIDSHVAIAFGAVER